MDIEISVSFQLDILFRAKRQWDLCSATLGTFRLLSDWSTTWHLNSLLKKLLREGVTAVEEPVDCPNVSRIACKYASIFQEFLQQSELPIWNRFQNIGFWRQLTVYMLFPELYVLEV